MNDVAAVETPLLITLEQAAQRLAISQRTLERLMAAGEFPAPLKLGCSARVEVADVDAYCAQLRSALVLSRACPDDSPLTDEILEVCRTEILSQPTEKAKSRSR